MAKKQQLFPLSLLDQLNTPGAGYDLLRYISLPDMLGTEADTILYFMGKNLARKFELTSMDDIIYFFSQFGWGNLELIKEKRKELVFYLLSDSLVQRLSASIATEFRLEAGFLAEAVQQINNVNCECTEEINRKIHQIQFRVMYTD